MKVGVSLTSHHDAADPREGARWMIERAQAARRAGLDSLFLGDHHAVPKPYFQNVPMLGRLLAEWDAKPAGCLFLLPLWNPVLVAPGLHGHHRPPSDQRPPQGSGLSRPPRRGSPRPSAHIAGC